MRRFLSCCYCCAWGPRPGRGGAGRRVRQPEKTRGALAHRALHRERAPMPAGDLSGDGQAWSMVAGGAEHRVVTGDHMGAVHGENNGGHGETPTDSGADRVSAVSTSLDRSSAASGGRRAGRHCDEALPRPRRVGQKARPLIVFLECYATMPQASQRRRAHDAGVGRRR